MNSTPRCLRFIVAAIGLALLLTANGCGQWRQDRVRESLRQAARTSRSAEAAQIEAYTIRPPDVVHLTAVDRPEWTGNYEVQPHGCIVLPGVGGVRVTGLTAADVAQAVNQAGGGKLGRIDVRVVEHRSQEIYLYGEVQGAQRAIAYQGPETVVGLLRRIGGITPDAAPKQVRVIRNLGLESTEPQVFHVDLQAILLENDPRTNVVLQPFDQIFIPESRQATFGKCLPSWFRPVARMMYPAS
jgi:protein involved in polysaccharide export with SLBB domain